MNMKPSQKSVLIWAIVLVVCNLVAFVIPFQKTGVFWLSDGFLVVSLLFLFAAERIAMKDAETAKSRFYGRPILTVAFDYAVALLSCVVVFVVISVFFPGLPLWIPLVFYILLTGGAAIGLITAETTRGYVEEQDQKVATSTDFMRWFYGQVVALSSQAEDTALTGDLQRLAEEIRYSDSVSSAATKELEDRIYGEVSNLGSALSSGDTVAAGRLCQQISRDLKARNALCKANKGR
ncbi:MAG: hypothetical protein LUC87_00150 [Clostridiales bacterium]|nr:hypothetical protein [Clostridiales bacterium]MCD8368212.1 hypothetical protein [Clostridiales bacterium]